MATYQPSAPFIYGDGKDLVVVPVTFDVSASGDLSAGTVVGRITSSGLYSKYNDSAADGTETAVGILLEDIDSSKGNMPYLIAIKGTFYKANLIGLDAAAETDLGARTISVSTSASEDLITF